MRAAVQLPNRVGLFAVLAGILAVLALSLLRPANAEQKVDQMTVEAGGQLIAQLCSGCHATRKGQASPHDDAPSLRQISRNYPVDRLEEALAEGMMVGHPDMPVFEFGVAEIDQIIAYLNTIQDQ